MASAGGPSKTRNPLSGGKNASSAVSTSPSAPAISSLPDYILPSNKDGYVGRVALPISSLKPETAEILKQIFNRPIPLFRLHVVFENGMNLFNRVKDPSTNAESVLNLIELVQKLGNFKFLENPSFTAYLKVETPIFCFDTTHRIDHPLSITDSSHGTIKFSQTNLKEIYTSFVPFENYTDSNTYQILIQDIIPKVFGQQATYRLGQRWTKKGLIGEQTPTPTQNGLFIDFPKPIPLSLLGKIDLLPTELLESPLKLECISTVAHKPQLSWADRARRNASSSAQPPANNQPLNPAPPKGAPKPLLSQPALPSSSNTANTPTAPKTTARGRSASNSAPPPAPQYPQSTLTSASQSTSNANVQVTTISSATQTSAQDPSSSSSSSSTPADPSSSQPKRVLPAIFQNNSGIPPAAVTPEEPKDVARNSRKRTRSTGKREDPLSPTMTTPPANKVPYPQRDDNGTQRPSAEELFDEML